MAPQFLLPETTVRENGSGPLADIGENHGSCLVLTFGITRIIEQESIDLSIWGSADGAEWGKRPIASFPQKFYCGTYQILLDLTSRPEVRLLQVRWNVNRWGKGDPRPLFGIYVFVQAMQPAMASAGA
jgi:hypothetical protein